MEFGDIELDLEKKVLINAVTGESIEVMKKEYLLLECLMKNSSRIVSKDYIYYYVWGFDDNESSSLEVYVSFVRRKLKAIGAKTIIRVARGLGYKLEMSESE